MAISNEKVTDNKSKCKQFVVYTGAIKEDLTLAEMSLRAVYDRAVIVDNKIEVTLPDAEVVVSIEAIEAQFPGTVERLTAIADWLNQDNPDGYKPQPIEG